MYKNKFKRFGGDWITDITEYLKEQIEKNPGITISVGCDSIQKRRRTIYACTIMMYDKDARDGAHVVFFRESHEKVRDIEQRLYKEAMIAYDIAEFLNGELEPFYKRKDIDSFERKKYKFHIKKCNGELQDIKPSNLDKFIDNIVLTDHEKNIDYKLVDIHVDFNPFEKTKQAKGKHSKESFTDNKSVSAYRSYVPWLRGLQYRVYSKPSAWAASSAADLLLQD